MNFDFSLTLGDVLSGVRSEVEKHLLNAVHVTIELLIELWVKDLFDSYILACETALQDARDLADSCVGAEPRECGDEASMLDQALV